MKKFTCILLLTVVTTVLYAQQIPLNTRYTKLCQVWGYLKYFHIRPSNCLVNWDSVLVVNVQAVKNASTSVAFNNAIQNVISAAGNMPLPGTPLPTYPAANNTNLNLGWFFDPVFTASISAQLDSVRSRFRPHTICNVANYTNNSWIDFTGENLNIPNPKYPTEEYRLLVTFRYWNYIEYFFNGKNLMDVPWLNNLSNHVNGIASAIDSTDYHLKMLEMITGINDTHASGTSGSPVRNYFGSYRPPFKVAYIENKVVVVNTFTNTPAGINKGDVISKINGVSVDTLMKQRMRYIPASNSAALKRDLLTGNKNIFLGPAGSSLTLEIQNVSGVSDIPVTRSLDHVTYYNNYLYAGNSYFQLPDIYCNIGYVHMGKLVNAEVNDMYDSLKTKDAIIFDIRNYPNGTAWSICPKLASNNYSYVKLNDPSITYPGIMKQVLTSTVASDGVYPYQGNIYVLVNEETQSQAEYSTMMLQGIGAKVKVIGSQTAGADGNISYLSFPAGFFSVFSTLGVFYPDNTAAQRTGVKINYTVTPTINGVRNNKDELLEFVLFQLEKCDALGVQKSASSELSANVVPNPFYGNAQIQFGLNADSEVELIIFDSNGKMIKKVYNAKLSPGQHSFNITADDMPAGVYNARLKVKDRILVKKLVIIRG